MPPHARTNGLNAGIWPGTQAVEQPLTNGDCEMNDSVILERLTAAGLYTAETAAKYLGISEPAFRDYRCRGRAPKGHQVYGKSLLFTREELDDYRAGSRK